MRIEANEFVHECVKSGMSRSDAIKLLRSTNTKLANLYEHWGAPGWSISSRIAAGKDMTEYEWECCCGEKKQGYIDTRSMWCERCEADRNTTNKSPNGEFVWRLPAIYHDEQEKARQLSAQQPKAIAKARENATQVEKRRKEVSTKFEGLQNANKMKPPPPPPQFSC